MVVHIGVILIAIALAASNSFTHSATLALEVGEQVEWGGHTFELASVDERTNDRQSERVLAANVILDGGDTYRPATTTYLNIGQDVGTPSVRTGLTEDIYLTLDPGAVAGDSVGVDQGLREADDSLAVDRWLDHGDRHAARRVPRHAASPRHRSGLGTAARR